MPSYSIAGTAYTEMPWDVISMATTLEPDKSRFQRGNSFLYFQTPKALTGRYKKVTVALRSSRIAHHLRKVYLSFIEETQSHIMKVFCPISVVAVAVALAVASPQGIRNLPSTSLLEERAQTVCGAEDSVKVQPYEISNSVIGSLSGGNSQCITVAGLANQQLSWSTSWIWSGSTSLLKSSPRAYHKGGRAASLWELHSIPTSWQWR